jgi:hypothetical protein
LIRRKALIGEGLKDKPSFENSSRFYVIRIKNGGRGA